MTDINRKMAETKAILHDVLSEYIGAPNNEHTRKFITEQIAEIIKSDLPAAIAVHVKPDENDDSIMIVDIVLPQGIYLEVLKDEHQDN